MVNRLDKSFDDLRARREGALIPLVPGDREPYSNSLEILDMFVKAGSDMVEIAIPTRYPWMEGRAMQIHQLDAIRQGVHSADSIGLMQTARQKYSSLPLIGINFMGPVFTMGQDVYVDECARVGIDCVDIPDYPLAGSGDRLSFVSALRDQGIHFTVDISTEEAVAPEGTREYTLLCDSIRRSNGFLFMIAQPGGASGTKPTLPVDKLKPAVARVRSLEEDFSVATPIIVVCGISTPEQVRGSVREVGADGVMLGSAVSQRLQAGEPLEHVQPFVAELKAATRV